MITLDEFEKETFSQDFLKEAEEEYLRAQIDGLKENLKILARVRASELEQEDVRAKLAYLQEKLAKSKI